MPTPSPFSRLRAGDSYPDTTKNIPGNVVVLGAAIADSLFDQLDPIGKVVRMNGREYEVVGSV